MPKENKVREHKAEIVKQVTESMDKSQVVILTNYSGMTTADLTALRRKLKAAGIDYRVVKNTLARFAADGSVKNIDRGVFEGPIAAAFGYDDPVAPAKLLMDFTRSGDVPLSIVGGILGETVISAEKVKELAQLPPREILLARVVGGIQWPLTALASCLAGPIRGLAYTLQARIKQLEEA